MQPHTADVHPICSHCWRTRHKGEIPPPGDDPRMEICCWCEAGTDADLYERADAKDVPVHNGTSPSALEAAKHVKEGR